MRLRAQEKISPSAEGDQGLCPVDLATFEKVDETFPCGFAAKVLATWCAEINLLSI